MSVCFVSIGRLSQIFVIQMTLLCDVIVVKFFRKAGVGLVGEGMLSYCQKSKIFFRTNEYMGLPSVLIRESVLKLSTTHSKWIYHFYLKPIINLVSEGETLLFSAAIKEMLFINTGLYFDLPGVSITVNLTRLGVFFKFCPAGIGISA